MLGFSDLTEQSQTGPDETVIAQFPVDFAATPARQPDRDLRRRRRRRLRHGDLQPPPVGPTPDVVDGVILATITTVSGVFEAKAFSSDSFARPDAETFFKVTAANDNAGATCRIKDKTVVLHST